MTNDTSGTERDTAIRGRISVGRYVRETRERLSLTQTDLADLVGMTSGNISKLEGGVLALPSVRAAAFARTLAVEPQEFGLLLFSFSDPHVFALVFPSAALEPLNVPEADLCRAVATLERRALQKRYQRRGRE